MVTKMLSVHARAELQRIDVGEGIQEVLTEACDLRFVESVTANQVLCGLDKNPDLHVVESRMLRFASVQSRN